MKKILLNGFAILAITFLSVSCKKDDVEPNEAPVVTAKYNSGNYKITVTASDGDGSIAKIEFIYNGNVKKTVENASSATWSVSNCGNNVKYTIKVYDDEGGVTTIVKTLDIPC